MAYRRFFFTLVVSGLIGSVSSAQHVPTTQAGVQLPAPDPVIQQWIQAITAASRARQYAAAFGDVMEAKEERKLAEDAWLTQSLRFLSRAEPAGRMSLQLRLMPFSRWYLGIDPVRAVQILAPYLESSDRNVANVAQEMVSFLVASGGPSMATVFENYLRACGARDPSWRFVTIVYYDDPDNALRAAAEIYMDRSRQQELERDRKELLVLTLSYDLASEERKAEAGKQIIAKLTKLADNPHWSVRGYALARIMKEYGSARPSGAHWSKETDLPTRLSKDENPFVSTFANALDRIINR